MCDKITRKGTVCKYPGKCPVHDLTPEQLSNRNKKAVRNAIANNPDEMRKRFSQMGKTSFQKLVLKYGDADKVIEWLMSKGIQNRIDNPSPEEKIISDMLNKMDIEYNREVRVFDDSYHSVDFQLKHDPMSVIEVDGFRFKADIFKDKEIKLNEKVRKLELHGYRVLVLSFDHIDYSPELISQILYKFIQGSNL